MSRKTFKVDELKSFVNNQLASSYGTFDTREGYIILLEKVLHDTDNYNGFGYLSETRLPTDVLPGINTNEDGSIVEDYNLRFINTDSTRRFYF